MQSVLTPTRLNHSRTAVAYRVTRYGARLAKDDQVRRAVIVLFTVAFLAAAVAGLFGAFINKAAPLH
jgi:hypothetical protein